MLNDTFQNFARLSLQDFYLYVVGTYVVERGVFVHLSNVIEMGTLTEALPVLGSLSVPLQNLTLISMEQSLTNVNKTTLHVLGTFNSTLLHLTIQLQPLLQRIEDDAFIWTPNLTTLNLNNNQINYLEKYAFNGLVTLQELNLDFNDLK